MRRSAALALVALLLSLTAAVSARAAEPVHPPLGEVAVPPAEPPIAEPLKDACGVAVDPTGRIFVANYYEHAIYVFNQERKFETEIDVEEPPFSPATGKAVVGPCDLAIDSAGNLYVNNWDYDVVRFPRLAPSSPRYGPGVVIDPHQSTGVTVEAGSDRVFVDDRTYVSVYEPSGAPAMNGSDPVRIGAGAGGIGDGYGVAVSGFHGSPGFPSTAGRVYVADAAQGRVEAYDPQAADPSVPLEVIDGGGTPQLGFTHLVDSDLAVDPADGHLYVVDNLQPFFVQPEAVVEEFSSLGRFRGTVPSGAAAGSPSNIVDAEPTAIAIVAGDIYVTNGNYYDDGNGPRESDVRVFGPAEPIVPWETLTATKTGTGLGTVSSTSPAGLGCGTACEAEFQQDRTVTLVAAPAAHSSFAGWTGCTPLAQRPDECSVTMDTNRAVSAEFEPIAQQHLTVARTGSGAGTVSSVPAGIDCGSSCGADFDQSADVILTAIAGPQSRVANWRGCDSEPGPDECAVQLDSARSVSAGFEAVAGPPSPPSPRPGQRILTVASTGLGSATGTVSSEPAGIACGVSCASVFGAGTTVNLVAHPTAGSSFLGWGGCDGEAGARCTVALSSDKTVTAAFGPGAPGPLRLRRTIVKAQSATLTVAVPAPGLLTASGKGLRPTSVLPVAAGPVDLKLRLSAAGRISLSRAGRHGLDVRVELAFSPFAGGGTVRAGKVVVFGRQRR